MPNKDNVEIEKILPLAAIGGAIAGAAGSAAGALGRMAAGAGKGGGGEDESEGLDEQDSHAQTEWENIHRSKSMQKLMKFIKADDWTVPSKDDDLDEASEEARRNWAKGKEAGSGFQRFGPIDHSKEKGSLDNPRDVMGHWRDEGVTRKRNVASPWGGLPRQFPVQQEGGISGPVTGATHRYGTRDSYDTSNASKWEEVKPSSARERARMGMENSLRKEGDTEDDEGLNRFHESFMSDIQRKAATHRPHTEWKDTHPDLFHPVGHEKAPLFLDPEEKGGKRVPSVHYNAYDYVDRIHRDVPMTASEHVAGLKGVHRSDMLQRHGAAVRDMDYDDAFPLGRARPNIPPRNAPKGQRPSQEYLDTTRKEMNIHDFLTDHTESMLSKVPSQHQEGVKRMFNKVAFESPSYKPTGSFETDPDIQRYFSVSKLMKFLRKEGGVGGEGGGFDGLSDTVFTSTNAGIFTPTYGGKGAKKNQRKNNKRQDKTRRKLMGKEKKSGVERLVQYLYDGSPHITKGGKMGLAPGLDDDMTGNAPTAHAGNNRTHAPHVPLENSSDLNHKRTSRPLEDAMEVAEKNEPHINMGLAGEMEASVAAAYPQEEDPSVSNGTTERKPEWRNKTYVQKSVNGVTTMISPDGNTESADGQHPQQRFIQRTKDNPNESPNEDAVLKENDMQRKRKQESNTEPEGSQPVAGLGLQMSSFGMNTYEQDSLARGGEEDTGHDEEDIDAKEEGEEADPRLDEDGSTWVPMNLDRTISLESMRKALEDAGDEAPLLTALYKLDYN